MQDLSSDKNGGKSPIMTGQIEVVRAHVETQLKKQWLLGTKIKSVSRTVVIH
jgi:hypothetical protein